MFAGNAHSALLRSHIRRPLMVPQSTSTTSILARRASVPYSQSVNDQGTDLTQEDAHGIFDGK